MLLKKMLRDMARHKMQFLSIFLMSFLGVFVLAGVGGEWYGLQKTADDFYAETNLPDVWLAGEYFTEEDLAAAEEVDGVLQAGRRLTIDVTGNTPASPGIELHFLENDTIAGFVVAEGEGYSADANKVWLDKRFADASGLAVGEPLSVRWQGMDFEKEIAGLVYGGEYVYYSGEGDLAPDFAKTGYAYCAKEAFPLPGEMPYNELLLATDRTDTVALEEDLLRALPSGFSVFLVRKDHPGVAMFQNEVDQHKAMGSIFPVAFFVVALLIILTTMTRLVNAQRGQIGTLKALGFKKRRVLWHYICYGLFLSLAGGLLGAVVGPLVLPPLFYPSMASFYTLPRWAPQVSVWFYVAALAFAAVCTVATWFSCRRILREVPAETLRPRMPTVSKRGWLEKTPLWARLHFGAQWNLRDVSRNKLRSVMAVVGVLACMALLVCSLSMNDSMDKMKTWQYETINRFGGKVQLEEDTTEEQLQDILNHTGGEAVMETAVELKTEGAKKATTLTVLDDTTLLAITAPDESEVAIPAGTVGVSRKLAQQLGVTTGDNISLRRMGDEEWQQATVGVLYQAPAAQGATVERDTYEALGYTFRPTALLTAQLPGNESMPGAVQIWSKAEMEATWDELITTMMMLIFLLIAAAVVLAVVVLYNLGLLSFIERERELATLRVIGFRAGKIRGLLLNQNVILSVFGVVLGIPLGRLLAYVILSTAGQEMDITGVITPASLALCAVLTLGLSLVTTFFFSGRVRKIDMAASLKGVE